MDSRKEFNKLMNEIREILKSDDKKEREARIVKLLQRVSPMGVDVVASAKDPSFSVGAYFSAFTLIALSSGSGTEVPVESYHEFTLTVMAIATEALMRSEKGDADEKAEEE